MHGPTARIVLCRVDVKDAFRQVLVDPVGAPVFGYAMDGYVVEDLRLQFGWRNSPVFWELIASALEHAHTHSTFQDAAVSPQGAAAVEHVRLAPPRGGSVRSLPAIVEPFPVAAATPRIFFSCGTTTAFLSRFRGGRTVVAVCGLCSRWRRTTFACWAYVARPTPLFCPPANHELGHASRSAGLVGGHRGACCDVAAT